MNRTKLSLMLLALASALVAGPAFAAANRPAPAAQTAKKTGSPKAADAGPSLLLRIPLFSDRFEDFPVATVDGDPITLREFTRALAGAHEERTETKEAGKARYTAMLDRLVTISLMVHEARNMGLDDLAEVKERVDGFSKNRLCD